MGYSKRKGSAPDVTLQKEKGNHKFTFILEETNVWNNFWSISKLTILGSEKRFSKNSYHIDTSQMICNAKQLAVSEPSIFLVKGISKQTLTHFQPIFHTNKPGSWFLLAKCLKKHLWIRDILSKDVGHLPVSLLKISLYHRHFLAYFASINQLSGFFMCGILEHWLEISSVRF